MFLFTRLTIIITLRYRYFNDIFCICNKYLYNYEIDLMPDIGQVYLLVLVSSNKYGDLIKSVIQNASLHLNCSNHGKEHFIV